MNIESYAPIPLVCICECFPDYSSHRSAFSSTPPPLLPRIGRFECYAKCLGMGAYKKVHLAFDQEEGVEVAWNELRLDLLQKKVFKRDDPPC